MSDDTDEQLSDSSDSSLYTSINGMSSSELHWKKRCLEKSLYTHLRILGRVTKLKAFSENIPNPLFHYYCVLDFECTCAVEKRGKAYSNEIIEFPSLLINASSAKIVSSFHSYCRPIINPVLSKFCTRLTGIKRENVDSAPLFPEVFKQFFQWIKTETDGKSVAFVTDGYCYIFAKFYFNLDIPKEVQRWIDLKESFTVIFGVTLMKISEMLNVVGLQFEGTKHYGMDDVKNISRLVIWISEFKIFSLIQPDVSSFSSKTAKLPYFLAVKRSKYCARLRKFNFNKASTIGCIDCCGCG
ncbi:3'-5' exoribonuclease 1 [Trichinella pseudospiralis]|uniref:3'-5' exoribonuclease 1 n=1 Tax=Trichinella pseudospiralis TaxID=6337 RepID=A0A0V1FAZ4_TRIPS|nr:3'-5' exoribonuclease 1 [Trichinella pseudospiralis]